MSKEISYLTNVNLDHVKANDSLLKDIIDKKQIPVVHAGYSYGCMDTLKRQLAGSYPGASVHEINPRLILDADDLKLTVNRMNLKSGDVIILSDYDLIVHGLSSIQARKEIMDLIDTRHTDIRFVFTVYEDED